MDRRIWKKWLGIVLALTILLQAAVPTGFAAEAEAGLTLQTAEEFTVNVLDTSSAAEPDPDTSPGEGSDPDANPSSEEEPDPDTGTSSGEGSDPDANPSSEEEPDPDTGTPSGEESDPDANPSSEKEPDPDTDGLSGEEKELLESLQHPAKPDWVTQEGAKEEPSLLDGQTESLVYGELRSDIAPWQLMGALNQSAMTMNVQAQNLTPQTDISNAVDISTTIWIAGTEYGQPTGDLGNIDAMVGDSFSYQTNWAITGSSLGSGNTIREGDYFTKVLFTVPNLNLSSAQNQKLQINGIVIGEWSLVYNPTTGEMTYTVIFNRYAGYFLASTVEGLIRGNGQFNGQKEGGDITVNEATGTITIEPRPTPDPTPSVPGGTGWRPQTPPTFNNNAYPFGKGVKWHNAGNITATPQIEWRAVFLEHLQQTQQEFLNGVALDASTGYCIIEDTLDENQNFLYPSWETSYKKDAPFFLEIPVMIPGTSTVLNSEGSAAGNGSYDGAGGITSIIDGNAFTKKTTEQEVLATPLSWTIVEEAGREKLIINVGKLGTADPNEGIVYDMTGNSTSAFGNGWRGLDNMKSRIQQQIDNCIAKAAALEQGTDSPIKLLDDRYQTLISLIERSLTLEANA